MLIYMALQYLYSKHEFETIFTSNDVINIQYGIGKGFGYRERAYSLGEIAYFGLNGSIEHMQHLTMDLENISLKLIIIDRHIFIHKN